MDIVGPPELAAAFGELGQRLIATSIGSRSM
jgi:hypothetical protein